MVYRYSHRRCIGCHALVSHYICSALLCTLGLAASSYDAATPKQAWWVEHGCLQAIPAGIAALAAAGR